MTEDEIIARALKILETRHQPGTRLSSPNDTVAYFRISLGPQEREFFACLFLDNQHQVLSFNVLFQGTVDGASVHPREVVRQAMKLNAAAVILTHNHPSGIAEPSLADRNITERLRDALALVDVRVLDHIIVTASTHTSFADRGLM